MCVYIGAQLNNIGDLTLNGVGCTSTGGRVEIFMMSQGQLWSGTISAVNFTKSAADVACHQLGYSGALTFDFAANTYVPVYWTCAVIMKCGVLTPVQAGIVGNVRVCTIYIYTLVPVY